MFATIVRTPRSIRVATRLCDATKTTSLVSTMPSPDFIPRPGIPISTIVLQRYSSKAAKSAPDNVKNSPHCVGKTGPAVPTSLSFWMSAPVWRRSAVNTLRCLIGCTSGDFSAMWFLQTSYPEISIGVIMSIAMISGLTTSMLLETALLRYGRDELSWSNAAQTAAGMSFISMLTMEATQNIVDYHLTGGAVAFDSPAFWAAAVISMGAGFLAPLPYNYLRLKKHGRPCH
ncbi:hypothetical protein GGR58DRAFT_480237 [Xylaria digitata]|nr:hypothetical protein GGR58DRAFT_480237 [Xylaria digitata]